MIVAGLLEARNRMVEVVQAGTNILIMVVRHSRLMVQQRDIVHGKALTRLRRRQRGFVVVGSLLPGEEREGAVACGTGVFHDLLGVRE